MKRIRQLVCKTWNGFLYPLVMGWKYFKGYWYIWYIRLVIIFIGLILVLVVLVQLFKSTCCVAMWLFTLLTQWAMFLSASAMFVLAGAAFWAIMDNRHGRKVDRMQRLQNAIVNWAIDARKALFVPCFDRQTVVQASMREKLEAIAAVSSIVKANASEVKRSGDLVHKVENAAVHLKQFIDNLQYTKPDDYPTLEIPWNNLKQEFLDVIESTSSTRIPEFQ